LEFNVPFQHKYGYIRDKRSGVDSYPYPVKEGQRYINLNPGRLFVQQPPKRERDREAHLNYYASAYNSGIQLSHCKTKLNQIQQNTRIILKAIQIGLTQNEQNKLNPGSVASYDLRPGNGVGRFWYKGKGWTIEENR